MSTLTAPARAQEDPRLRPVPWRRMVWVTWRQHRPALVGLAALLGALAVYVWTAGLHLHHAYAAATACHPANSVACSQLIIHFDAANGLLRSGYMLQVVPALIGAFVGAPVLARELETGTFRFTWTQGFGPWRWTLAKLVLLGIAAAAAAGALSVLLSWYYHPYLAAGNQNVSLSELSPLDTGVFSLRGIAFAAWTLAAFAIGSLAGLLISRVVAAIIATLVAYTGLAVAAALFLRQHYMTPLVTSRPNVPGSALVVSQWWTKGGRGVFGGRPPLTLLQRLCPPTTARHIKPSPGSLAQCLSQHGYTQWTRYQPAGRFWTFQWIEAGWLLALSVLLGGLAVWLVHRPAASLAR
jgi:hypothetical protein